MTGPVGVTVGEVIVAVNVTACPTLDGFTDGLMLAEVFAGRKCCGSTADALPKFIASPRYTATSG